MIFCPECGEENPDRSKFCRKCGVNLVYEEPEEEPVTAKKVTVETDQGPVNRTTVNTNTSTTSNNNDNTKWWSCCICLIFIFIIFAIFGH